MGEAALEQLEPAEDIHATAAYRAQLVRVLTERVVRAAQDMVSTSSTAGDSSTTGDETPTTEDN